MVSGRRCTRRRFAENEGKVECSNARMLECSNARMLDLYDDSRFWINRTQPMQSWRTALRQQCKEIALHGVFASRPGGRRSRGQHRICRYLGVRVRGESPVLVVRVRGESPVLAVRVQGREPLVGRSGGNPREQRRPGRSEASTAPTGPWLRAAQLPAQPARNRPECRRHQPPKAAARREAPGLGGDARPVSRRQRGFRL